MSGATNNDHSSSSTTVEGEDSFEPWYYTWDEDRRRDYRRIEQTTRSHPLLNPLLNPHLRARYQPPPISGTVVVYKPERRVQPAENSSSINEQAVTVEQDEDSRSMASTTSVLDEEEAIRRILDIFPDFSTFIERTEQTIRSNPRLRRNAKSNRPPTTRTVVVYKPQTRLEPRVPAAHQTIIPDRNHREANSMMGKENDIDPSSTSASADKQQPSRAILNPRRTDNVQADSSLNNIRKDIKPAINDNNNNNNNNAPAAVLPILLSNISPPEAVTMKENDIGDIDDATMYQDPNVEGEDYVVDIPKELNVDLYPYQQEGFRWMYFQETRSKKDAIPSYYSPTSDGKWSCTLTDNQVQDEPLAVRGGILADDMGVGKTLQTIALILANRASSVRSRATDVGDVRHCTLIVCPVNVMGNWTRQIEMFVSSKVLNVETYHGTSRADKLELLAQNKVDVLVTSYPTLRQDYKKYKQHVESKKDNDKDSLKEQLFIFDQDFRRLILDEGHEIRNSNTDVNEAVMAIEAIHKWVLTGTPLFNKPSDVHALFRFLGAQPFDDETNFYKFVTCPIENKQSVGMRRLQAAMESCTLRRTKDQVKEVVQLPSKEVHWVMVECEVEGVHATTYSTLYGTIRAALLKLRKGPKRSFSPSLSPLTMVQCLQRSCCHAELVPEVVRNQAVLAYNLRDTIDDPMKLLDMLNAPKSSVDKKLKFSDGIDPRSPKIVALNEQIKKMEPSEKGVIFSQSTDFLDIIECALLSEKHTFTRIDGSMTPKKREIAMEKFSTQDCDSCRFILCSLFACGTGINLTRANHVFMMDIWWNSSVEMQAYDRVHRVGQFRDVRVVYLLMKDSIEERMLKMQEAKQALGKGCLEELSITDQETVTLMTLYDLLDIKADEDNGLKEESDDV